jgi:hypothetical protein
MTDNTQTAGRENVSDKIIDMDIKEVHISTEELAQNYVDVKQAGQLLNNASERTVYRLLNDVKDKFKFEPAKVSVSQNGVRKNMYLKDDILKMADFLHKQPAVIAYRTEFRTADNDTTVHKSDIKTDTQQSGGREIGRAEDQISDLDGATNSKLAVIEGLKSITELRGSIRELNDNVRGVNTAMQNIMTRVVEQGIDLKERYLKDREERTNIERQQVDNLAKQSEAFTKQSQALIELTQKIDQSKPVSNPNLLVIVCVGVVVLFLAGWGAFYFFTTNQQKMEYQFEEKLSEERQIQQDQFQQTLKQLKQSLAPATTGNGAVPSGQGTK